MQKTKSRPIFAYPTEELRKRLDDHHRSTGAPMAEIVRRALDEYLPRKPEAATAGR